MNLDSDRFLFVIFMQIYLNRPSVFRHGAISVIKWCFCFTEMKSGKQGQPYRNVGGDKNRLCYFIHFQHVEIILKKIFDFLFPEMNFFYLRTLNINICRFMDMKRIILSFLFLGAMVSGLTAQTVQDVDAVKFNQLLTAGNNILLDVRTPGEYSRGHIKGSTNINIADPAFVSKVSLLQKDKTILVYCLSGSRSDAAASFMSRMGFNKIYTLQRGIMTWTNAGFPLEQSTQMVASNNPTFTPQSFDKVLKDNKVVLVDFNAEWCAPCKTMNPILDKVSDAFKGKAKVEKVDVEANKAIAQTYQVQSIPGFVLFKGGQKVWSHTGVISYEDLSGVIKKYL